jgi:hypothetical protein
MQLRREHVVRRPTPNSKSNRKAGRIAVRCMSHEASEWVSTCMHGLELALASAPLLHSRTLQTRQRASDPGPTHRIKSTGTLQGSDWTCRWEPPEKKTNLTFHRNGARRPTSKSSFFFQALGWALCLGTGYLPIALMHGDASRDYKISPPSPCCR